MTRDEFIIWFLERRKANYKEAVRRGTMRPSEAAMGMVEGNRAAVKAWKKSRSTLEGMRVEDLK